METAQSVRNAFDLTGRVALVTGAGSGIGRTTAEVLAGAGATVVCADINSATASETAAAILGQGGRAESAELNVAARGAPEYLKPDSNIKPKTTTTAAISLRATAGSRFNKI